jgi:hypothetical protein
MFADVSEVLIASIIRAIIATTQKKPSSGIVTVLNILIFTFFDSRQEDKTFGTA